MCCASGSAGHERGAARCAKWRMATRPLKPNVYYAAAAVGWSAKSRVFVQDSRPRDVREGGSSDAGRPRSRGNRHSKTIGSSFQLDHSRAARTRKHKGLAARERTGRWMRRTRRKVNVGARFQHAPLAQSAKTQSRETCGAWCATAVPASPWGPCPCTSTPLGVRAARAWGALPARPYETPQPAGRSQPPEPRLLPCPWTSTCPCCGSWT